MAQSTPPPDVDLESGVASSPPCTFVPDAKDTGVLGTADLEACHDFLLLDARSKERFVGQHEPIDTKPGHVPGARNYPFTNNLDEKGKFLPADILRERLLQALGETPPERVAAMCGSGVTACHNLLAMEIAGLGGGKLYVGSWSEWIRDPRRPVATNENE